MDLDSSAHLILAPLILAAQPRQRRAGDDDAAAHTAAARRKQTARLQQLVVRPRGSNNAKRFEIITQYRCGTAPTGSHATTRA